MESATQKFVAYTWRGERVTRAEFERLAGMSPEEYFRNLRKQNGESTMIRKSCPRSDNMKIKHNKIKCKKCGDVIESVYRHDFKWCSCESVAVDGGKDYLRRCGKLEDAEEMSEYEEK